MTLTDRDRKILLILLPVVVLAAYWFLVLAPKRDEAASLSEAVTQAQGERDAAVAQAQQAEAARSAFEADYATMLRLGKAVPTTVDMPSLLVQLDAAASGTDIVFQSITAGERTQVVSGSTGSSTSGSTPDGNAAPGGTPAGTAPGQAAEQAGEAAQTADAASAAAGAAATASPGAATPAPAALESVPLQFTFNGSFFHLADFFHELKRFVRLTDDRVDVRGRLVKIDSITLTPTNFPQMQAQVTATAYLSPKGQGVTAGATPQGPAPAGSEPTPAATTASTSTGAPQ